MGTLAGTVFAVVVPGTLAAFGAGLVSFLSPCVLPLVPGYLSLVSGLASADIESPAAAQRIRILGNAALFVVGFSVVFIAYGAVASSLGSLLLSYRRQLTVVAGVVIIAMGLLVARVVSFGLSWRSAGSRFRLHGWGPMPLR